MDQQALSRVHRIGQNRKTFVHRFIIKNTVEEKIDKLRIFRQEQAMDDDFDERRRTVRAGGFDGGFDQEELQDLLRHE